MIARGVADGQSCREIGRTLVRAPSTIRREIKRNGARTTERRGDDAATADARAWRAAKRPKVCRLAQSVAVARTLRRRSAPRQIAEWLATTYPEEPTMQVSAETIYQSLHVQARGLSSRTRSVLGSREVRSNPLDPVPVRRGGSCAPL